MKYNKKILKILLLNFIKLAPQFYFSKLFLIIFLFFSNINSGNSQVCIDRFCRPARETLANTPTPVDPSIFNPENSVYAYSNDIHKITFKDSSLNIFIYTNYLAPADSINTAITPKHALNKCQNFAPLSDVGEVCMYDIAPQCPAGGSGAGINCINYSSSFNDTTTKKLQPKECVTGMTHGLNCMNIKKLKYCQEVEVPILGLNCKLPACSFIPNNLFRRPGVNCLADCLDTSGKQIFQNANFIEGVNCLTPCSDENKLNSGECVLKFLKNVIPFCTKEGRMHYNVATTSYDIRSQCMDIKDAEKCITGNGIVFGDTTCFPTCSAQKKTNCIHIAPAIEGVSIPLSKKCHHLPTTESSCEKISCSKLTPNELTSYENNVEYSDYTNENYLKSNQKYCLTTPYNQFTYEQLTSSKYLNHYTLINKPCSGYDGTTFEMSVLSSLYYYTNTESKNMVDIVNAQCTSQLPTTCSPSQKNNPESTYVYSANSYCKGSDMVETISCQNYKNNQNKPYDCNSTTPSPKTDCSLNANAQSGLVACCPEGATNCYKTNINCNLSSNADYQVCKATAQAQQFNEPEDKEMSWFFRPAISSDAIESYVDVGQTKYRNYKVSGDAFSKPPNANPNKEIRLYQSHIKERGWLNDASHLGTSSRSTSPGAWSDGLKTNDILVGFGGLCGVDSSVTRPPSSEGAYFKGVVKTVYKDDSIEHGVYVCLRKVSPVGLANSSCGERRCRSYTDLVSSGASCGTDHCRLVKVTSSNEQSIIQGCPSDRYHFEMGKPDLAGAYGSQNILETLSTTFGNLIAVGAIAEEDAVNISKPCLANFKTPGDDMMKNVRVRLFKPDPSLNYICGVIEMRNVNANVSGKPFFKGHEFFIVPTKNKHTDGKRLYRKLCFSGKIGATGNCVDGINYNDEPESLYVWRAARIIKFVDLPPTIGNVCGTDNNKPCDLDYSNSDPTDDNLEYVKDDLFVIKNYGKEYIEYNNNQTDSISSNKIGNIHYHIGRKDITKPYLYEKSDCITHQLRLSTPINYSVARISNSRKLFLPPIKINKICPSSDVNCDESDKTDFAKPSLIISWGNIDSRSPISDPDRLFHYKRISISNPNIAESDPYKIIPNIPFLSSPNSNLEQTIVLKKQENESGPIVCLYRRLSASSGSGSSTDIFIGCKPRKPAPLATVSSKLKLHNKINFTPIDYSYKNNDFFNTINLNNTQNLICQSKIPLKQNFGKNIKLHAGVNFISINSIQSSSPPSPAPSDDSERILRPSFKYNHPELTPVVFEFTSIADFARLENLILCKYNEVNQGYQVCLHRHKCTMLNVECLNNEKNYLDEIFKNEDAQNITALNNFINYRKFCIETLLPECNRLKGLAPTSLNTVLNPSDVNGFNQPAQGNFYGWYNEICIIKGTEIIDSPYVKKYVIQNNPIIDGVESSSTYGKCVSNPDGSCVVYDSKPTAGDGQLSRLALPHELGLCLNFPNYKVACQPIMQLKNPNLSDPFYTSDLINIHFSHTNRSRGINLANGSKFYAEFNISFPGNMIYGECNGFWKENIVKPYARCDSSGQLTNLTNSCIRYTCPEKTVPDYGADKFGDYPFSFDAIPNPILSKRGNFHGYSKWPSTLSSDAKQNIVASNIFNGKNSCIMGYKRKNSDITYTTNFSSTNANSDFTTTFFNSLTAQDKLSFNSLFGNISNYINGTAPSRLCNQLGEWEEVQNPCERITCPALDFIRPSDENAFDFNNFNVIVNGRIIGIDAPIYSNLDNITKIKFKLNSNLNQSPIYANPTDNSSFNNIILKNSDGSNITSLIADQEYVFELTSTSPKTWKKINNSNDQKLRLLWQKIGGAKFSQGFAHRSSSYFYRPNQLDANDQSFVEGECQESLGYKHLPGNPKPILFCDNKGNWQNLQNVCISDCAEVSNSLGNNPNHGYSTWSKTSGRIDQSLIISANSCVTGFRQYPYDAPYDEEGDKGDFGNNSPVELIAGDNYDGTASSSDGALFTTTLSTTSSSTTYDLKIVSSAGSVVNAVSVGKIGDFVYELFNLSSITLNASNSTVWSDIKFASYGTPDYSNQENLTINPSCHSDYSRLNVAKKCIGKRTCTLSLSDFTSYDSSINCDTNLGNGKNGSITTDRNFGSGGGGGGGNFLNSAQNGGSPGQLGLNGISYCDRNFHFENKCDNSIGSNQGSKVDLTQPMAILGINQFDGKNGYALIKQYTNSNCSGSSTSTTFNSSGLHSFTVSGSTTNDYCIEYELVGGGGGGGGAGVNLGTNGSAGNKIIGKFVVKGGTILTIYVGEGGKSGKTKCIRENTAIALLDKNLDKNSNFAQLNKVKNLKKLFNHQPIFAKVNNKKSNINFLNNLAKKFKINLIQDSYAADCYSPDTYKGRSNIYNCGTGYNGYKTYDCNCPQTVTFWQHGFNSGNSKIYNVYETITEDSYSYRDGWNDECSAWDDSTNGKIYTTFYEHNYSGNTKSFWGDWDHNQGFNDTMSSFTSYLEAGYCSSKFVSSTCTINSCTASGITGFSSVSYNYGTTSLSCNQTGYNGTLTVASCTTNGTTNTPSGTCNLNSCTARGITGFNQKSYNYPTTSLTCDQTGYNGTLTVASCTTNGTTNTPSGTCNLNSCTANGATGFDSQSYTYSGANKIFNCKTGYSGTITFPDCTTNGASNNHSTNNCKINCSISKSTYDSSYGFTVLDSDFASDGTNKVYNCSTSIPYNGGTASFSCNSSGGLSLTPCSCATNYSYDTFSTGKKCVRKCTISSADATAFGIANSGSGTIFATNDYILNGSDNIYPNSTTSKGTSYACSSTANNPAYNGGSITLNCGSNGTIAVKSGNSGCNCASGYTKDTNSKCQINTCTSMVADSGVLLDGIDFASLSSTNKEGAKSNVSCNKSNFSGTFNYVCQSSGVLKVTTNNCSCQEGFALNPSTKICEAITCNASETDGYSAKTSLPFTLGTTKGKILCQKTGYHNHVEYTCKNGTGTTGTLNIITTNNNCAKIPCVVPANSNLNVSDGSTQDYGSILGCATGYSQVSAGLSPVIKCSTSFDPSSNLAINITNNIIENSCVINQCLVQGTGNYMVNYSPTNVTINCQDINPGWYGTGTYNCNANKVFTWVSRCKVITCQIPLCNSATCVAPNCHCPAPPVPAQETISDGSLVYYRPSQTTLSCKNGYESLTPPSYTCTLNNSVSPPAPKLELAGIPCTIKKCTANTSLNSIIDSTLVNWTGATFVNTSCKNGFYQNSPSLPPQYRCDNDKNFNYLNPCLEIRCSITPSTNQSYGMKLSNQLDNTLLWTGETPSTIPCNANGFSGNITYKCTGNSSAGILLISSNSCIQNVCDRSFGSKNTLTFDSLVSSVSSLNIQGIGGGKNSDGTTATNPAFNFLKGGNGGNSSSDFTSGSGGGGGQASMIAINNKIIAIAGGGGGGAGGGANLNTNTGRAGEISYKLLSNVFGNYLYLKISNIAIVNDEQSTAGVFFTRNNSNEINITPPNSKLINQIEFSTLGNPLLTPSLSTSFDLKHGTCKVDTRETLNICLSESSCSITNLDRIASGACVSNDMGVVASYVYAEPKLRFANETTPIVIKELVGNQLTSPTLENNKVYTFYKLFEDSNYWIKSSYSINNIYLVSNATYLPEFKVRFHRTNTSFEPKLKFIYGANNISMIIKKSADQNVSIGYIKPGVSYVLKNQGTYWEIKKHIPEYANKLSSLVNPQRTCRTVKLQNNIARMWSQTSSRCINKCPGFDYDDRIGAGATLHRGSSGFKKVRWPESNLNSYVILKIDANSSGPNNTFNEYTGDLSPGNFTGIEPYFVVARYCNNDGSWGDPIYLCQVSGGSSSDRSSAPANSLDEFITANSYNSSFGNSTKYISANRTDKADSDCLNGFYKDLNSGIIYNPSNTKPSSQYICSYNSSQINAKFERVLGAERRCIKYCTAQSVIDLYKYNLQSSTLYKSSSGNFNVACSSGYLTGSSTQTSSIHSCNANGQWDPIAYQCRQGRACSISDIQGSPVNQAHGDWAIYKSSTNKSDFFPLKSFIANVSVSNVISNGNMNHGASYTFPTSNRDDQQSWKYGRCGYVRWRSYDIAGSSCTDKFSFVRKYLRKIDCYDGNYIANWAIEDESEARKSCSGWTEAMAGCSDEGGTGLNGGNYIGWAKGSNIGNANEYNNITETLDPPSIPDPVEEEPSSAWTWGS